MTIDFSINTTVGSFTLAAAATLPLNTICAVFGPSGCGKTTLLRCIAGLNRIDTGFIRFGTECWNESSRNHCTPASRRGAGVVFQDARLFPHLSVLENLRFGFNRTPVALRRITLMEAMDTFGLVPLAQRLPRTLSGGEQQRVALARASVCAPRMLLLDEPVSALDRTSRNEILSGIESLISRHPMPVLYVSHSVEEVSRLCTHLLVMERGTIVQDGPMNLMRTRINSPLTLGGDAGVTVETSFISHDETYHLSYLACGAGTLSVARILPRAVKHFRVHIKARDVSISLESLKKTSILNSLESVVTRIADDGPSHCLLCLDSNGTPLVAHITRKSRHILGIVCGQRVFANIKSVALVE